MVKLFTTFVEGYDVEKKDAIWTSHSQKFRTFWNERIMAGVKESLMTRKSTKSFGFLTGTERAIHELQRPLPVR